MTLSDVDQPARTSLTVYCVAFGLDESVLHARLVRGAQVPSVETWSVPGGPIHVTESLEEAARRHLARAGVVENYLEQFDAFETPWVESDQRDVAIAYYALANMEAQRAGSSGIAGWFPIGALPELAPSHEDVVLRAYTRLREKLRSAPVGYELLPARFSLTQLQHLYEAILGIPLDKRNFRKKVLATQCLIETDEVEQGVRHRAAKLFRFDRRKYDRLVRTRFRAPL